jgi:hypothetical protein
VGKASPVAEVVALTYGLGEQHQGQWRFWRDAGGSDAWMADMNNG